MILIGVIAIFSQSSAQTFCPGNLVTNSQFSSGMANWSQYGLIPTATVLNAQNGCLDTFLIMQATNNSNCGVVQNLNFSKDSCYSLCYCVEFPFTGVSFNTKLTVAAITSGITVTQLLTGAFTPAQAKIIDVITATTGFPPYTRCPAHFTADGNYTGFVIVNETTGLYGTDVRVDNICLLPDTCGPSCNNVTAGFTYTVGAGNTVNFTDISTSNPGDLLSWSWDFGDPPSGANNFSTLQNPAHTYPAPGVYFVCLYLNAIMTNGLSCADTFCLDVVVTAVGTPELEDNGISVHPNPAKDHLKFTGTGPEDKLMLVNAFGQVVLETILSGAVINLPATLPSGMYYAIINTLNGKVYRKVILNR